MSERPKKRRLDVRARVMRPDHAYTFCRVVGCGKRATAGTAGGLNQRFCRKHQEHYNRHGSPYKGSYKAPELAPHRRQAGRWLNANAGRADVRMAVSAVDQLYIAAGPHVGAHRVAGRPPDERARAIWASLRDQGTPQQDVIAVWLAIEATIRSDLQPDRKPEYRWTQAGKILHRMAGGEHKRWERERSPGRVDVIEMHKYTQSRGRILRHLGSHLETAAAGAAMPFLRLGSERSNDAL